MSEILFAESKTSILALVLPLILMLLVILFVVSFYLFIKRMVTARYKTEQALKRIEAQLELIMEKIEDQDKGQQPHIRDNKGGNDTDG